MPQSKFTIVIPTHERQEILRRSIDYYKNFSCNILIADSSLEKMCCDFPDNIIYKHLPGKSFLKKIFEVVKTITTPYVCYSGDDDYLLETGLQEAAHFLDSNLDFSSVQGRYLKFELTENKVVFSPRYNQVASCYSVTDENVYSRIIKAYNPYMAQFSSIHRTNIFTKLCRSASDISNAWMVELTSVIVPMCYGKHKVLPILWMVRDSFKFYSPNVHKSPKPKKSENILISSYRGHQHALNEIKLFLNSKESLLFKSKLAAEISELVGDVKESDKIFNAAFKSFTNWLIKDRNKCIIKIIVKSLTPAWIVNNYRERKSNQHMGGVDTTSPSKDALNKIRFSVLAFAKIYNNSNKHKIKT